MFVYPWGISEDNLTGDFFGLMKYLPPDVLLSPFLDLVQSLYPERNIKPQRIKGAEVLIWPEYKVPKEWQSEFNRPDVPAERGRKKYYIVPDAVIHLDEMTFIVEAEKSHSVEAEQLFQQYLIGRRQFLTPKQGKHNLYILLINTEQMRPHSCRITLPQNSISPGDSIPQYIEKRAKMLGETCDINELNHSFLWISWHHIGKLTEKLVDKYRSKEGETSEIVLPFLSGLKEMTDKEGFYPVRVFRADDPNEVCVGDYSSIPIQKIFSLPNFKDFMPSIEPESIPALHSVESSSRCDLTDFEGAIDPSLIPTFRLFGDLIGWLVQHSIQYDTINVLEKGGNCGNKGAN
jgi:hypothetical protein